VLLPSDTHRKPITSITAVLLPFVAYLLTLSRTFTNRGQLNIRNVHYWVKETQRRFLQIEYQRQWNVNACCVVTVGHSFTEENLNGERYAPFLLDLRFFLLEAVPLGNRMLMWYQHDGCPAHHATVACTALTVVVDLAGRSPDLTPLYYFYGQF
jgi:hypothetical protein